MHDFIPVTFVVQLILSVLIYFGGRGQHEVDADGVEVFRISPSIAWMLTMLSFLISLILAVGILTSKPAPVDAPASLMLGELLFFFFGMYGLYCITMRIRVDTRSLRINSLFGTRVIKFGDIRSATDKTTGRYRTLDVTNTSGKRVLYVTSTFLPDYDSLVDLLQTGARESQMIDAHVHSQQ